MAILRFSGFGGENRALDPMLLPETVGVTSTNQKPGRGDLRPWAAPSNVSTPSPSLVTGPHTIYRMGRDVVSDTNYWLSWPTLVHVVCAPNAADTDERTYFSGGLAFAPRWTNKTLALASAPYPTGHRQLGVPAPSTIPILSAAPAAALSAADLEIGTTYTIATIGTTNWLAIGAEHKIVSAGSFVIGTAYTIKTVGGTDYTLIGASASTVGVSFTASGVGMGSGTATKNDLVGVTFTAIAAGSGTGTVKKTSVLTEYRNYLYTFLTDIGEESAPSQPSLELTCKSDDIVTITGFSVPSGSYGINRIRIYRTTPGSADYYFLREIASTATTTTDDERTLGAVLATLTWLVPPTDLSFLTGLWNGMLAGISGRSVRFCEPNAFYAWPMGYEVLPSNAQPVALATYGQVLVMLTNGNPSLITGGTPDAMDEQPLEFSQACIAPASAVGLGHGVAWASPDGLAYVGSSGARLLTEGIMTRDDWQAINPSSIQGCMYERRYFGFYILDGVKKGFVYDFNNPNGMYFLDFGVDAFYLDDQQDTLFVLNGINVQKFDAGALKTVTFKSKQFQMPRPTAALACAEVVAHTYPATFKLYADGVLKHTQTVTDINPFRLPSGYRAMSYQVEVSTTSAIQGVAMAHAMTELGST